MNSNLIIAIIGVGIAFGGFLFTYFGWIAGLYKAVGELSGQIAILDKAPQQITRPPRHALCGYLEYLPLLRLCMPPNCPQCMI